MKIILLLLLPTMVQACPACEQTSLLSEYVPAPENEALKQTLKKIEGMDHEKNVKSTTDTHSE